MDKKKILITSKVCALSLTIRYFTDTFMKRILSARLLALSALSNFYFGGSDTAPTASAFGVPKEERKFEINRRRQREKRA